MIDIPLFVDALKNNTKKLIAGRGVKSLFTDIEAPTTFKDAFKEGGEVLSRVTNPRTEEGQGLLMGAVGSLENAGKKIVSKSVSAISDDLARKASKYLAVEELSDDTKYFLDEWVSNPDLISSIDKKTINELRQFVPDKPVKLFRGISSELEDSPFFSRLIVGGDRGFESWTHDINIAKQFGEKIISKTFQPNEIIADLNLIKNNKGFSPYEGEVLVKTSNLSNSAGKTTLKTLLAGAGAALGAKALFTPSTTQYEAPKQEEPQIKAPAVVDTKKTLYGNIYKLATGTEVRDIHKDLAAPIKSVYAKHPDLPKGLLEALLMKESTMGHDNSNANPKIGRYAWLVGMTPIAKKDLLQHNIVPDLDTREGAIEAAAQYWKLRSNPTSTPLENYNDVYSSGLLKPEALQQFDDMFKYYATSSKR